MFGFKVPTLDFGFTISEEFLFGFVHLYVNGEINPILKLRSGFVSNPEQLKDALEQTTFNTLKFSLASRLRGHKQRKLNDHVYLFSLFVSCRPH